MNYEIKNGRRYEDKFSYYNPCGWLGDNVYDALSKAYWADRLAAFGGAIVTNRPLDIASAELIADKKKNIAVIDEMEQILLE